MRCVHNEKPSLITNAGNVQFFSYRRSSRAICREHLAPKNDGIIGFNESDRDLSPICDEVKRRINSFLSGAVERTGIWKVLNIT